MALPQDLDNFLNPKDAPMALSKDVVDPYTFDMNNERNSVGQNQIRDFSFSSGFGGTLTLGGSAGILVVESTAAENGTTTVNPIIFNLDGTAVARLGYRRYTPGTTEVTDIIQRSYASTASSRVTYNTMDIYPNAGTAGTARLGFLQISVLENGGTVTTNGITAGFQDVSDAISFSIGKGATGTTIMGFGNGGYGNIFTMVRIGTAQYAEQYITLPKGSADPASAGVGSMYYDATTGKIRGKHASGWADL